MISGRWGEEPALTFLRFGGMDTPFSYFFPSFVSAPAAEFFFIVIAIN